MLCFEKWGPLHVTWPKLNRRKLSTIRSQLLEYISILWCAKPSSDLDINLRWPEMITSDHITIIRHFGSLSLLSRSASSHPNSQLHQNFEMWKKLPVDDLNFDANDLYKCCSSCLGLSKTIYCLSLGSMVFEILEGAEINPRRARVNILQYVLYCGTLD